ncbi:methylsterol monooxygenase 1-1-like [Cynara cardunculus var. scolymus]|uniref:Fatty acid hydroxylase n=1 Tax=Cynara cardunculus var. scolymus TaxID=59895 RepID=A0A124SB11_CYNCS|nr:methylsterol monooxygenase 1-1-like [Cynara cardunculus var. scolymus]KVH89182.1 Fatty acid hydroxylase [Cynara cardunculus var. scolymus]
MLAFECVEEIEVSLGRKVTSAEAFWLNYSANKSDYFLYCHNLIFLIIFYSLLPLPYVILQLIIRSSKNTHKFKIQPNITYSFTHMFDCYTKVVKLFLLTVGPLQLISFPIIQFVEIRTSLPLPSKREMFLQIVVYFIVEDYANYWLHRLLHTTWAYEKIHRVHHEYSAPMSFAASYAHWAEVIILGFASFLGPLLVPCHMITMWLWMIVRHAEAIETHSGYDLPWSPTRLIPFYGGAEYHDYHHYVGEKAQSNFASVFTYCDYIYGTDKGYRYAKKHRKGVRTKTVE